MTPREILEKLVSFPTVSSEPNLDLVEWVEGYLADHGIASHRYTHESGQKAAVFAHVGPEIEGGVILSGHTDVVPVEGQDWTSDPFTVTERDGKLYGRGTADMKGFDALALWAMGQASKADLKRPMQIALSFDEEVGCTGAPPMIEAMQDHLPKAELALIGEPSRMKVVTGHKGGAGYFVHVKGHEVHSSIAPEGVSAVMRAATLIEWANQENARIRSKEPSAAAKLFYPAYTTYHAGMINGGTANNITAGDCTFSLDYRLLPSDNQDDIEGAFINEVKRVEGEMKAIHPDSGIELKPFFGIPPLRPEVDGPAEALARRLTGDNGTHTVSYGTEAGQFQDAGYSAVVCGPGDIDQAHKPDEFIEISELNAGQAFMERLIKHLEE